MTDKPASPVLKPIQSQFRAARSLHRRNAIRKPSIQTKSEIEKHGSENKQTDLDRKNGATTPPDSGKAAKSSAQVARLVAPNACGLKPGDEFWPHSDNEAYEEYDWESTGQDWQDERPDANRAEELILRRILADEGSNERKPVRPKPKVRYYPEPEWKPDAEPEELESEPDAEPETGDGDDEGGDSEPQKRPHPLGVRFSAIELEIVKAKARTVGCSVNGYVRAAALGSNYRPPRDPELTRALLMVNRELTAQGNNLNQIARQLNAGIVTPAQAESMVEILARSLLRTHKAVRQALGLGDPEP